MMSEVLFGKRKPNIGVMNGHTGYLVATRYDQFILMYPSAAVITDRPSFALMHSPTSTRIYMLSYIIH